MFRFTEIAPGVKHIQDAMGVCFTLIEGEQSAVLFDTGYGTEDVQAYVRTLTDKPVKVYLSHGHHDHMLGARWFGRTWLDEADMDDVHYLACTESQNPEDESGTEVIILKVIEDEETGEELLSTVDSDEELEAIFQVFEDQMFSDDDGYDEDEDDEYDE